jgi:hypothetical protein
MNAICSRIFKMNILFIAALLTISCNKDSDLVVEYMLSDELNKERLGASVENDYFKTATNQSVGPDVFANDTFTDLETAKITKTSASSVGH